MTAAPTLTNRLSTSARRLASSAAVGWMRLHKRAGLPVSMLPSRRLRQIDKLWPEEMQREYVRSGGTKLPYDEPCKIERVPSGPLVDAADEHRLTQDEHDHFWRHGFLRPFDAFDPEEIKALGKELLARREEVNPVYGFKNDRDRHLQVPGMLKAMRHPAIVERLAQLLGPDLMSWRSQIFYKPPGGKTIAWHQASTYLFEEGFTESLVVPPRLDELFMLTVWIPTDPATLENGCLQFVKNSFRDGIRSMRLGGDVGFHALNFRPDYEVDPADVVSVEMKPGQVLIFSERTVHGSQANHSDKHRFAFNYRVTPTNVKVYPDPQGAAQHKTAHKANQMAERYDLSKWGCVQLRGRKSELNRTLDI